MTDNIRVLIVDDEEEVCISLSKLLETKGFSVIYSFDTVQLASIIERNQIEVVLLDVNMPEKDGINVLQEIHLHFPLMPVIMISGFASVNNVLKTMRLGAINFYEKPIDIPSLVNEINTLIAAKRKKHSFVAEKNVITRNKEVIHLLDLVNKYAATDAPVVIMGETGTGKEVFADLFHRLSRRSSKPFIKINCAAIPDTLLESELFGYEKGAFTGALDQKKGKLELANQGTVFLDEIGDMSLNTQAKILRVLEEKQFMRVGGLKNIQIDCRIIAATNKNLKNLIEKKGFREDLFYRLSVITLELPPLRERREDIIPLAQYFTKVFSDMYGKNIENLSDAVVEEMLRHDWPGNIRELRNFVERAVIFTDSDTLEIDNCATLYSKRVDAENRQVNPRRLSREVIREALLQSDWNKIKAAQLLGISRTTLYNKIEEYSIEP